MQHPSTKTPGTDYQLVTVVLALCTEQEMEQNKSMESCWK